METIEERTQRVLDFYNLDKAKKSLEGRAWVQGTRVETLEIRVSHLKKPLHFDPELESAQNYNEGCMQVLLDYLQTFQPIDKRGFIFYPSAKFSLHLGNNCLSLYMNEEKPWGQSVTIDVFEREKFDAAKFEEFISLLQEGKISSFVLGKLREKRDYPSHTLLRRYFLE